MRQRLAQKEHLTNERLRKLFQNNFQLTNQAIELGRFYIRSGHEINMGKLLEEIIRNPHADYLKDLQALERVDEESNYKE